jgi:hypothetical protein
LKQFSWRVIACLGDFRSRRSTAMRPPGRPFAAANGSRVVRRIDRDASNVPCPLGLRFDGFWRDFGIEPEVDAGCGPASDRPFGSSRQCPRTSPLLPNGALRRRAEMCLEPDLWPFRSRDLAHSEFVKPIRAGLDQFISRRRGQPLLMGYGSCGGRARPRLPELTVVSSICRVACEPFRVASTYERYRHPHNPHGCPSECPAI